KNVYRCRFRAVDDTGGGVGVNLRQRAEKQAADIGEHGCAARGDAVLGQEFIERSEERRVGKECRSRRARDEYKRKLTLRSADVVMMFFFSSRRRHTRSKRDWSSDVCSSDLKNVYRCRFRAVDDTGGGVGVNLRQRAEKQAADIGEHGCAARGDAVLGQEFIE